MKLVVLTVAAALNLLAFDDSTIQATTPEKVEATRSALVRFVWGASWADLTARQPRAVAHQYKPQEDDNLPAAVDNLESIDRLEVGGAVASTAFVFYPAKNNVHKAVILHQGHACTLLDTGPKPVHLEYAIRKLVEAGYTVAALRMPLYQSPSHCAPSRAHDKLFDMHPKAGSALQYFMEPNTRTVNYLAKEHPELQEVDMIGLSGGGWTTTLYAAVDPRIIKSIPVAGTLPLYLRGPNYNHDLEQYFAPIYSVAGYKDLYVLGASGSGRMQLQILNRYDDCCFGEKQHSVGPPPYLQAIRAYEQDVRKALPSGSFSLHVDESAHYHQISTEAIDKVILPVLAGGAPPGS